MNGHPSASVPPMDIFVIAIEHPLDMMVQRFHPAARPDP
jgi:hypothetical protein